MALVAEVMAFQSQIDGSTQHAGLCGPDRADDPLPLLVELEPGSIANLEGALEGGQRHLGLLDQPAVWLRPGGRGPGTLFHGYGEVDVFEAIEAAARYPIDRDRISVYGGSMGGAATWYMGTHWPDRFSAIAPFAAYNDYRIWNRPGGMTFQLLPWEVPSWEARSPVFLLENLRNTGIWITHGEWDRAIGGGVDVLHSRNSVARLTELGIPHRYSELKETGHGAMRGAEAMGLLPDILRWMVAQRRPVSPATVDFVTYELRHHVSHWIDIQQLQRYGVPARVRASAAADTVTVQTENVRHLVVGPAPLAGPDTRLVVDGQRIQGADVRGRVGLHRTVAGTWEPAGLTPPPGEKRPGLAGPFADLFIRGTVLVRGTTGTAADVHYQELAGRDGPRYFSNFNGGVHRGGLLGESWVKLPVQLDTEYLEVPAGSPNVLAFGRPDTNGVLAPLADRLPVQFAPGAITIGKHTWHGEKICIIAALPWPGAGEDGPDRYLAVHGGVTPDATTYGGAHALAVAA